MRKDLPSTHHLEAPTLHFGQPFQQSKRFLKNVVEVHRTLYIGSESSDTMYIEKMTYRLNSFARHVEMSCNFLLRSFTYLCFLC